MAGPGVDASFAPSGWVALRRWVEQEVDAHVRTALWGPCADFRPQATARGPRQEVVDEARQRLLESTVGAVEEDLRLLRCEFQRFRGDAESSPRRSQSPAPRSALLGFRGLQLNVADQARKLRTLTEDVHALRETTANLRHDLSALASMRRVDTEPDPAEQSLVEPPVSGRLDDSSWQDLSDTVYESPRASSMRVSLSSTRAGAPSHEVDSLGLRFSGFETCMDGTPGPVLSDVMSNSFLSSGESALHHHLESPIRPGRLSVKILALHSMRLSSGGVSKCSLHPFIKARIDGVEHKVEVVPNKTDLTWRSEPFFLPVDLSSAGQQALSLEVMNHRRFHGADSLGSLVVGIGDVAEGEPLTFREPLEKGSGEVTFQVCLVPRADLEAHRSARKGCH